MVQVMDTDLTHRVLAVYEVNSVIGFIPSLEKMQEEMWREQGCEVDD